MKKRLAILLFSLTGFTSVAQNVSPQIKRLAFQITDGITRDSLKVRAIFEWITENIAYDIALSDKMDIITEEQYAEAQKSEKVIQRKKAVCMGYTNLFQDLCTATDIKAFSVYGYSKNIDPYKNTLYFSTEKHSWNAVKINNKWYLCDPTWSAGTINLKTGLFEKKRSENFYLKTGEVFIKRYIPFDPLWQLLDAPINMEEFRYGLKPRKRQRFNYLDTLSVLETLSPEQQRINASFRSLRFDSENDEAKSDIAYYFAKRVETTSKTWHDLVLSFMNKNTADSYRRAKEAKDKVYSLLTSIEEDLNQARYYYSLVSPTSQLSGLALSNIRRVDHSIYSIEKNRESLDKYYDMIKKMEY